MIKRLLNLLFCVAIVLLASTKCFGAIALDSVTTGHIVDGSATNTVSHECSGDNRLLVVAISGWDDDNTSFIVQSVTYNGDSLTKAISQVGSLTGGSYYENIELWYMAAPDTGTHDIVVTFAASTYSDFVSASYTGVDQSDPLNSNIDSDEVIGDDEIVLGLTTTESGEVTVSAVYTHYTGDTAEEETLESISALDGGYGMAAYRIEGAAGAKTHTYTSANSSNVWIGVMASFYPTVGAPPSPTGKGASIFFD